MYQKVQLIGNVGADLEPRYTNNGVMVVNIPLATSRRWTDANGQQQEETIWWKCVAWDRVAKVAAEYVAKGRQLFIEGELLPLKPYQDTRSGEWRCSPEIRITTLKLLGHRGDGATTQVSAEEEERAAPPAARRAAPQGARQAPSTPAPRAGAAASGTPEEYRDEDIPF